MVRAGISLLLLSSTKPLLASGTTTPSNCEQADKGNASVQVLTERWSLVDELEHCLEQFSQSHVSTDAVETLRTQLETETQQLQSINSDLPPVETTLNRLEAEEFSSTTKLTGLAVLGVQYGDSIGDRPLIRPLTGEPLKSSRPSSIGASFMSLNTSFSGNDLLKTTLYAANRAGELLSRAQIGNSRSTNSINTFFIPSRMVWSLVPQALTLYRLSYQFKPTTDLTLTAGPKFFPTDIVDRNTYTNPITTYNSWSMIGNSLITPYQMRLIGGAGAGLDWNIDGGPVSLRGVYIARRANLAVSDTEEGGLFNAPYQGTLELEYRDKLSDRNSLVVQLQYTHSDTSGVEQDAVGLNAELDLGNIGLFGRVGHAWAQAEAGVNPLPFSIEDADRFQTTLFQAGVAVKDLGWERSLLSIAVGQPFRTTLDPAPNIPKRFQTNLEAFYRVPLSDNLYLAPTLLTVFNPNNRGDQPTLMQGFLRFTVLY